MINLHFIEKPSPDSILHCQPNTGCHVDQADLGRGSLFVTKSNICWIDEEEKGFNISYHDLNMHAISSDLSSFPHPCIFLMTSDLSCGYRRLSENEESNQGEEEGERNNNNDNNDNDNDVANGNNDDDEEEEAKVIQIRFVPQSESDLALMYEAINKGNILNPCQDSNSEEDDFEPEIGQGDHSINILNGINGNHNEEEEEEEEEEEAVEGQFEDADDQMES